MRGEGSAVRRMRAEVLAFVDRENKPLAPIDVTRGLGLNEYDNNGQVSTSLRTLAAQHKVKRLSGKKPKDLRYLSRKS